jgi:hypothetical protein
MAIWTKIKIEDEDADEFLECFIAVHPIPDPVIEGRKYTPVQWWREWNRRNNFRIYKQGKKKLAPVIINEEIVTQE